MRRASHGCMQQINQFLDAMSPPDPDGMYSVAKVDSSVDQVELYRQRFSYGKRACGMSARRMRHNDYEQRPRRKRMPEFYAAHRYSFAGC